jgi:hypothetical protein
MHSVGWLGVATFITLLLVSVFEINRICRKENFPTRAVVFRASSAGTEERIRHETQYTADRNGSFLFIVVHAYAQDVHYNYDRGANFQSYRTYQWFGVCAACEDLIGLKRLQAVPWARHCLDCQERFEHVQRHASMVGLYCGNARQG